MIAVQTKMSLQVLKIVTLIYQHVETATELGGDYRNALCPSISLSVRNILCPRFNLCMP